MYSRFNVTSLKENVNVKCLKGTIKIKFNPHFFYIINFYTEF